MKEQDIGRCVHMLSRQIKRNLDEVVSKYNVTSVQCAILEFIYMETKKRNIYAKDIESEFDIRKSTIAEILSLMEKNELIERQNVAKDARLKKLVLTQKAIDIRNELRKEIKRVEKKMRNNLTDEEIKEFIRLIMKISNNL